MPNRHTLVGVIALAASVAALAAAVIAAPATKLKGPDGAPLLLFFGGQDDYIPQSTIDRIDRTLTEAGKVHEIVVYPDVGHAFFRESSAKLNSLSNERIFHSTIWPEAQSEFRSRCITGANTVRDRHRCGLNRRRSAHLLQRPQWTIS